MISHVGMRSVQHDSSQYLYSLDGQANPPSPAVGVGLDCPESQIPELLDCSSIRTVAAHVRTLGTATTCKEILNGLQQQQDLRNSVPHDNLDLNAAGNNSNTEFMPRSVSLEYPKKTSPKSLNSRRQSSEASLGSTSVQGKITKSTSGKVLNLDLGDKQGQGNAVDAVDAQKLDPRHIQSASAVNWSTLSNHAIPTGDPSRSIADRLAVSDSSFTSITTCLQSATVDNTQDLNIPQTQNPLHYANAKTVPRTTIKIYINAPIPDEYQQRSRVLVDFFKRAVDNDSVLKYRTKDVNYELRICGKSPEDASPTIVVFCTEDLFDKLSRLLESDTVKRQYRSRKRSILSPVRKRFSREPELLSPKLHFKLIFWREPTRPTKRKSADEVIKAQLYSYMSTCGSLITFEGRTATLAMLVSVDSTLYGLTVGHIRRGRANGMDGLEYTKRTHDEASSFGNSSDASVDSVMEDTILAREESEEGSDSDASDISWDHDVDYEGLNINDSSSDGCVTTIENLSPDEAVIGGPKNSASFLAGHFVDVSSSPSPNRPFLDWALIQSHDGSFERPNAFSTGDSTGEYKFLTKIAENSPNVHTAVLMISGSTGTRKGFMLPGSAYIGGDPDQDLCEAWVVDLPYGVVEGDCGSLVVNAVTWEVYGHVIASNPLGQAYIAPLRNTFDQITSDLGAEVASLPDPLCGLIALSLHYLDSGKARMAAKVISHVPSVLTQHVPNIFSSVEKDLGEGVRDVLKGISGDVAKLESESLSDIDLLGIAIRGHDAEAIVSLLFHAGVQATLQIAAASGHVSVVCILIDCMISKEISIDQKTMMRINDLAASLEYRGIYLKAETLYERAYRLGVKLLGEHDSNTMISGNGLGQVLEKCGRYREAEDLDLRISQARTSVLGADHPDTLTSISNYASALNCQGSYAKAEERHRFVLEARRKVLGDTHIDTMTSMSNLAGVLENGGNALQSKDLNDQVLAMREVTLGPDHLDTLTSFNNLAHVLTTLGRYWQAEPIARRATEGYEKVLGPGHPFTLATLSNLATVLKNKHSFHEAEQLYQRVLVAKEDTLGAEHPSTLVTVVDLAQLYQSQKRYPDAKAMNLRALTAYKKTLGSDHPVTLSSIYSLAYLLHTQEDYQEATVLYEQACEGYKDLLGLDHPTTKACIGKFQAMKHVQTSTSQGFGVASIPSPYMQQNYSTNLSTMSSVTANLQLDGIAGNSSHPSERVLPISSSL